MIAIETVNYLGYACAGAYRDSETPAAARARKTFRVSVAAFAMNAGITAYHLTLRRIKSFTLPALLRAAFKVVHPSLPAFAIGVVLLGSACAKMALINAVGLAFPSIFIHELGHFIAANLLFEKAHATINVIPFKGGDTQYAISHGLTELGKWFGRENALLLAAASGFISSGVFAMVEFSIAKFIKEKYPELSDFMHQHAITQVLLDIVYGVTTLLSDSKDLCNDFTRLWVMGGIHPIVPLCVLGAILVLKGA